MPESKGPKTRAIIGVIVTEPLDTPSVFRNPLTAFAFALHVFNGEEPSGLDMTLTLESEKAGRSAGDGFEIVSGNIQLMRNTLTSLPAESRKPKGETVSSPSPEAPTTIVQLCIVSVDFADLFSQVMAKMLPINVDQWLGRFRSDVRYSAPTNVIWVDMLNPDKLHRADVRELMQKAIPRMVA